MNQRTLDSASCLLKTTFQKDPFYSVACLTVGFGRSVVENF
jgi:hypothetical protein